MSASSHDPGTTGRVLRVLLALAAVISVGLFAATLLHTKALFNPADWISRFASDGRLLSLETWDAELYQCPGQDFNETSCQSISGSFLFAKVTLPLHKNVAARMLEFSDQATHLRLRHALSLQDRNWLAARSTEEFLAPVLLFFKNRRCFLARGPMPYCDQRTESLSLDKVYRGDTLDVVFLVRGSTSFGPHILPPLLVESNLMPRVISLDDKATAAFASEGIVLVTVTLFFGILAIMFPAQASVVIMFLFCLVKNLQTALGYIYENQVVDWVFSMLGSSGYIIVSVVLNALILALLLYLTVSIVRGGYKLSKLEIGYGLGLVGLFIGMASIYGHLGELSLASLFTRDAIGTLFGAIWIMYHLFMEWHEADSANDSAARVPLPAVSSLKHLKTFVYLFFLVSYGAAGAQTVLGSTAVPDLLPWQSMFFVPGIGLAVLLDLAASLKSSSPVSRGINIGTKTV